MKRFIPLILMALSFSCINSGHEEKSKFKKLNNYFDRITKYDRGMGSVAIINKGEMILSKNYGHKDIEKPIYRIGSISKVYTSVIIMKLIEENKIGLDTKLSLFYKDIHHADEITIEHLLRHRSGLPNYTRQDDYLNNFEKSIKEEELIKRFYSYKLEFKPNESYKYSDTGYILLTYIAQKVSSLSYPILIEKYISQPLGLKNTFVFNSENPRKDEVQSYKVFHGWRATTNTHENVLLGAGAIAASADDVATFIRALFHEQIVSKDSLSKMTDIQYGYGLGLLKFPYKNKNFFGYTGKIDNFRSIVGYNKEDDFGFVSLTNGIDIDFNDLTLGILASFYDDSFEIPDFVERQYFNF